VDNAVSVDPHAEALHVSRLAERSCESKSVKITRLEIPDLLLIVPKRFEDPRGYFTELYNEKLLGDAGVSTRFVQDNFSLSRKTGTVRGLHYQTAPRQQAKLVRVSRGRILDVALDLRQSSASFGKHISVELSAENGKQIFIPAGFAHGFCTLENDTEIVYKVSDFYDPQTEQGVLWSDPELNISWPVLPHDATVSEKDAKLPLFKDMQRHF
jgi:dTDP-4-dehydrorhamnose 3,5-epimerase